LQWRRQLLAKLKSTLSGKTCALAMDAPPLFGSMWSTHCATYILNYAILCGVAPLVSPLKKMAAPRSLGKKTKRSGKHFLSAEQIAFVILRWSRSARVHPYLRNNSFYNLVHASIRYLIWQGRAREARSLIRLLPATQQRPPTRLVNLASWIFHGGLASDRPTEPEANSDHSEIAMRRWYYFYRLFREKKTKPIPFTKQDHQDQLDAMRRAWATTKTVKDNNQPTNSNGVVEYAALAARMRLRLLPMCQNTLVALQAHRAAASKKGKKKVRRRIAVPSPAIIDGYKRICGKSKSLDPPQIRKKEELAFLSKYWPQAGEVLLDIRWGAGKDEADLVCEIERYGADWFILDRRQTLNKASQMGGKGGPCRFFLHQVKALERKNH